jgi:hypothetical protein
MSSSADSNPVIVIDVVDDESSTDNVIHDGVPSKTAQTFVEANTLPAGNTSNNINVETLKIPPPAKVSKERLKVGNDVHKSTTPTLSPASERKENSSTVQIVKIETPSSSPSSYRKRHPSKEEDLQHLTEEVEYTKVYKHIKK